MTKVHYCRYPNTTHRQSCRIGSREVVKSFENRIDRDKVIRYNPWRPGKNKIEKRLGYTIDLNRDGKYTRGTDAVLAFDMDGDGKYNRQDVIRTNEMMKSAVQNYDLNSDGRTTDAERKRGAQLRSQFQQHDLNGDGKLSSHEMSRAGGRLWIDKSKGGGVQAGELHSIFNVPSKLKADSGRPTRLDQVDPLTGTSVLRNDYIASKRYHCHESCRPNYRKSLSHLFSFGCGFGFLGVFFKLFR